MQSHILCTLQQRAYEKRGRLIDSPVCSPDLSPIGNVWYIIKHKLEQWRPWAQQLKSFIKQERDIIPLSKLQQLAASLNSHLLSVGDWHGDILLLLNVLESGL